jgi:hypothetical protein
LKIRVRHARILLRYLESVNFVFDNLWKSDQSVPDRLISPIITYEAWGRTATVGENPWKSVKVRINYPQRTLSSSPDFWDTRLSPIDWPCPKMVQFKFLAAKPNGVIPSGPSKDWKLAKHSILYLQRIHSVRYCVSQQIIADEIIFLKIWSIPFIQNNTFVFRTVVYMCRDLIMDFWSTQTFGR